MSGPFASQLQPRSERRSEEHTSELQSHSHLVCRLLLEKNKKNNRHERGATTRTCLSRQPLPRPLRRRGDASGLFDVVLVHVRAASRAPSVFFLIRPGPPKPPPFPPPPFFPS